MGYTAQTPPASNTTLPSSFIDTMVANDQSFHDGTGIEAGAITPAKIDFTKILLGNISIGGFSSASTTFTDVTGSSITIASVPTGVTKLKVSLSMDNININSGSAGQIANLQCIDESSNVVFSCTARQTASIAGEFPIGLFGISTVTAGSSKTYKLQIKINGGTTPGITLSAATMIVEVAG